MNRLYLDHAATTPLLAEAEQAMLPWLGREPGNPSSLHAEGRKARAAVDEARETVADALGVLFGEVLFCGSGTEAAAMAVIGTALARRPARDRILLGAAEHHCVLHCQSALERLGARVELVPVDREGRYDAAALEQMLGADVALVSLMHANNELGSIQDIPAAASLCQAVGAWLHTDAVQTFPHCRPSDLGADMISFSAHKVGGPKGVGGLWIRSGVKPEALIAGGGQEREMRGGTENVAGIVGLGAAVRHRPARDGRQEARDAFAAKLIGAEFTLSPGAPILPGHCHLRFPGISAESLLIRLDRMGVSASAGAACSSGSLEPSHVLLACGYSVQEAAEGVRFSFGVFDSAEFGELAAERVNQAVSELRSA